MMEDPHPFAGLMVRTGKTLVPVAQLDRAMVFYTIGCRFKSYRGQYSPKLDEIRSRSVVTQYYGEDPQSTRFDTEEYQPMETWRKVWREGVVPLLSTESLVALAKGLREDDPRIIQGTTASPPPLYCVQDWPIEASCPLSYCGWQGDGLVTVAEVEEYFAKMCYEIDQRLGEPAGCRHVLNWIDETPRAEMRRLLLEEVDRELKVRVG